jgi:hypothetical protein
MPAGLLVPRDGSGVLVTEMKMPRLRFIDGAARAITTVAGDGRNADLDGEALSASFDFLTSKHMVFDASTAVPDSLVYIANSKTLRRFNFKPSMISTPSFSPASDDDLGLRAVERCGRWC